MKTSIRVLSFALLIAWMLLIFNFSAQTATESSKTSGGFSYKIAGLFVNGFEDMTPQEQQAIIENMSFPVRKSAHFCIFAILAVIAFLNLNFFKRMSYPLKGVVTFVFSGLYAASDEYHQKFVLGRSCELGDWFVDSAGILTGILFCGLVTLFALYTHHKRE